MRSRARNALRAGMDVMRLGIFGRSGGLGYAQCGPGAERIPMEGFSIAGVPIADFCVQGDSGMDRTTDGRFFSALVVREGQTGDRHRPRGAADVSVRRRVPGGRVPWAGSQTEPVLAGRSPGEPVGGRARWPRRALVRL
ncbi:hypothetical protein Aph01nite_65320 [Acrocarpospora phusangensis]|uniref:Uncharacterized protein n=1 Tax=Acrocarpospora phusangensis TaxID=1070424 RepID=A0A919QFX3_9ACTN|nr:hypothetical protein Aph01nite_65320 [Acrocarpospora phusangensis]